MGSLKKNKWFWNLPEIIISLVLWTAWPLRFLKASQKILKCSPRIPRLGYVIPTQGFYDNLDSDDSTIFITIPEILLSSWTVQSTVYLTFSLWCFKGAFPPPQVHCTSHCPLSLALLPCPDLSMPQILCAASSSSSSSSSLSLFLQFLVLRPLPLPPRNFS